MRARSQLVAVAMAASLGLAGARSSAYGYVFSTFKGDDAAGMKLSIYTSSDAFNFTLLSDTGFGGPSGYLRDPSIMKYVDGKYYVTYTDPLTDSCCGKEDHFSIAVSTDLCSGPPSQPLTRASQGSPTRGHRSGSSRTARCTSPPISIR